MQILKAALMGVALIPVPAFAQGETPVVVEGGRPTAIVSYADLDIGSASGVATLNGRIHRAAKHICFEDGRTDLATRLNYASCFNAALASAKVQVDSAAMEKSRQIASHGAIRVAAR
jgi:UrcA family protein